MLKVSIITVCLNNADTLESTIKSVQCQTYPSIEYIIVDGVSTDGTVAIIEKYRKSVNRFISEKDGGIYFAINKGIKLSSGDVIGILHADDFYVNNEIIAKVADAFSKSGSDCVYGDLQYVNRNNPDKIIRNWITGEYKPDLFRKGWMPPHPSFFIKRECMEKYGDYNTALFLASDYEFMLRMIHKNSIKVCYIPEVLVKMRVGGASNKSILSRIKNNLEDRKAWRINKLNPYPFALFIKPLSKIGQFFR